MVFLVYAIPVDLRQRLHRTLLACGPFATDSALHALFSDQRISPWRHQLPQTANAAERVEVITDFLGSRYDAQQRNALAMFLQVLTERVDERDACHHQLATLADEVARELTTGTLEWPDTDVQARRIFVCYSRRASQDEALARFLQQRLESHGHSVFIDRTMRAGSNWLQQIDEEIRNSDYLLVLLSEVSADSEMVQAEVRRAYEYRRQNGKPQTLPVRLAFDDALPYTLDFFLNPLQYVTWRDERDNEQVVREIEAALSDRLTDKPLLSTETQVGPIDGRRIKQSRHIVRPLPAVDPRFLDALVAPGGTLSTDDDFYIQRESDWQLQQQVAKRGSTITIRAPRQSGKSSLLVRGVQQAREQGGRVVYLDMQRIDQSHLMTPELFLNYLATFIARRLRLDPNSVEEAGKGSLGPQDKLTYWLEEQVLEVDKTPVTLAMDEVDRLLETAFHNDFFALVRSWHNNRAFDERWADFNVMMVISTEPYLLINEPAQSPFNVGLKLYLEEFEPEQVYELNRRHGAPVKEHNLPEFIQLFGGHPYLTRMALYVLVVSAPGWQTFLQTAPTDQGPFSDHLRRYHWLLSEEPALQAALKEVIRYKRCSDERALFRLLRAGLVKGSGDFCLCRCDLYRLYFSEKLL